MFSKLLLACLLVLSIGRTMAASVPFSTKGALAKIQNPSGNGDTRIYYQPEAGTITEYSLTGPFDIGKTKGDPLNIVPPSEVLQGTPISAVIFGEFKEVHFFFLSPDRVLSEYYWTPATRWKGGPKCTECVTALGVKAAVKQNALSASINPVNGVISVGFVSAKDPGTLSEAVRRQNKWAVSVLPGK